MTDVLALNDPTNAERHAKNAEAASLKSLEIFLNDLPERFGSKNAPFVQAERGSERCQEIHTNQLKLLNERLNAFAVNALRQERGVRSER